jgi:aminopeptidase
LRIACDENSSSLPVPAENKRWLELAKAAERDEIVDEERTRRCVLHLPTLKQAQRDNMSFDEYCNIYFQACNLPWEEIAAAQENLAQKFTAANTIEITADLNNPDPKKRTQISMSVEGMSFINSHIRKNYPGAEIFSAPLLNSTNGSFYSPGRFFRGNSLIRDIYLKFENGRVVDFDASEGREALKRAIETDAGSCYVGEIGIGTNPHLTADVSDSLLFEKKGGSFHLALGSPYKIRIYDGKPVKVDNGGDSSLHWDITQMLINRNGSYMKLDGEIVQQDGLWLDPALHILNPEI